MKMALTPEVQDRAGQDFKPVPAGVRDLEIRQRKEERASIAGDSHYCNVGFVIASGANPGRWVWDRFMTDGAGIGRAAGLYKAVFEADPTEGVKIGQPINPVDWLEACVGRFVKSEVVLGVDQQGKARNYVGGDNGKGTGGGFRFEPSTFNAAAARKAGPPSKKAAPGKSAPAAKKVAPPSRKK